MSKNEAGGESDPLRFGVGLRRKRFLQASAIAGTGFAVAGPVARAGLAANRPAAACGESVREILATVLGAEPAILRDRRIAGSSANPNAVADNGDRGHVASLQAALDQEDKHARIWHGMGARTAHKRFYFPVATFDALGYTTRHGTFLWVLDHLETTVIAMYLAAAARFDALGRDDLALLALRILGVESEHRALYRLIAGDEPADNVTVEVSSFACVEDVATALRPFLTGQGFAGGGTARAFPSREQIGRAVGRYTSR